MRYYSKILRKPDMRSCIAYLMSKAQMLDFLLLEAMEEGCQPLWACGLKGR